MPDCACLPIRMRLNTNDIDSKLAAASLESLKLLQGRKHELTILAKELASESNSAVSGSLDSTEILKSWQSILTMKPFISHRLVLILELDNFDASSIVSVNTWLAKAVAPLHDRLIVVVGGIPNHAELIHAKGTWAYRLKTPEKTEGIGQPITNDEASGPDLLELTGEINALTDAIASVELRPPLVVGICGGWGAGKSFVLNLMDRRLQEIRKQKVLEKDALHVGHIYWIEFDAWTYSKKNLWARLMDQICCQFEEQLNIERIQFEDREKPTPRIPLDLPPWAVSKAIRGTEPSDLREYTNWTMHIADDQKNLSDLLIVINDKDFAAKQTKLIKELKEEQKAESSLWENRQKSLEQDLPMRITKDFVDSISNKLLKALGVDKRSLGNLSKIQEVADKIDGGYALHKKLVGAINSPYIILLILIGFGAVAHTLIMEKTWTLNTGIMSFVTSVGLAVARVRNARDKIYDLTAKSLSELDQRREAALQVLTKEYDKEHGQKLEGSQEKQKKLRADLDELRRQSGIPFLELQELQGFLEKIRTDEVYTKHLGLMNQVQEHLERLSLLVTEWSKQRQDNSSADEEGTYSPFQRGVPRIVLTIDDLDRCPPAKVVEVLEATQLLVKTDLFVVLFALDLRYVTRAIEKFYDGILDHTEHPTGLDYIEKIIQLPYQVRPIAKDLLEPFFNGQLKYISDTSNTETRTDIEPLTMREGGIPARTIRIPEALLHRQVLQLTHDEFDDIVIACKPFSLSPRAGKRISNVYKIWKLLWHQRQEEPAIEPEIRRVMVALLALSTVRPCLAQHGLRTLANWVQSAKYRNRLLNKVFFDFAKNLNEPPHIQDLFAHQSVFPESVKVGNILQQNLSLLTSFSFVGDDDHQKYRERVLAQIPKNIASGPGKCPHQKLEEE